VLCRFSTFDRDAEQAEYFRDRSRALLGERPRQILKVAGAHVIEHFDFFAINGLQDKFVIE